MSIKIDNLRITPFSQKDGIAKVVFGGAWGLAIQLPTAHVPGDEYALVLDYERIVYPAEHPVCALSTEYTLQGMDLSMSVELESSRLAKWLSSLRKPTPIYVQICRLRGGNYETLLLDEILALPSMINPDMYEDPDTPIGELLDAKLDKPAEPGEPGQVLTLDSEGEPAWRDPDEASKAYAAEAAESARQAGVAESGAVAAKDLATQANADAQTAKTDSVDAKNAAVAANTDAQAAKTDAVDAKNTAVSAKNDAVSAKDAAVQAKNDAQTARTDAQNASASASTSSAHARTWAEGDDEAVEALGGEHSAKGWAERVGNKADRPATATAGHLAALTATRDLADSGVPAANVAQQDGYYGGKGLGAATAENLIDIHATGVPRMFTLDTAAGEASIAGDGNGRIEEIRGVTNTFNQMVADTNINTVTGTGVVQVSDAVAGNVTALEVSGRTYARNQRVSNGNFASTDGWSQNLLSLSAASNVLTGTVGENGGSAYMYVMQYIPSAVLSGRSMLLRFDIKCPYAGTTTVRLRSEEGGATWGTLSATYATANSWQTVALKWTSLSDDVRGILIYPDTQNYASWSQGDSFQLRNVMLCDLTQCFGGDATAIAAVSTWADLVARIPEYGSYVATDAGTLVSRGGTVTSGVWNQMVNSKASTNWASMNVTFASMTYADGVFTMTAQTGTSALKMAVFSNPEQVWPGNNHVYLAYADIRSVDEVQASFGFRKASSSASLLTVNTDALDSDWRTFSALGVMSEDARVGIWLTNAALAGTSAEFRNMMLIDLTAVYGPGNEPATAAEFEANALAWGHDMSQYQAYDAGTPMGGSATFTGLRGVGSTALDTQELVGGEKTEAVGVASTADLAAMYWQSAEANADGIIRFISDMPGKTAGVKTVMSNLFPASSTTIFNDATTEGMSGHATYNQTTYIAVFASRLTGDLSTQNNRSTAFQNWITANNLEIYYELATPTTTTLTPQPLTTVAGFNAFYESAPTITGTPLSLKYTGTDYSIPTISGQKYLSRINGVESVVNGGSPVAVKGGRDRLINLTRWCGAGLEPSTTDGFYALYPWMRGYDMPYMQGTLKGYEGTGIETVGFNLLNIDAPFYPTINKEPTDVKPYAENQWFDGVNMTTDYWRPTYCVSSVTDGVLSVACNPSYPSNVYAVGYCMRIPYTTNGCQATFTVAGTLGDDAKVLAKYCDYNGTQISYTQRLPLAAGANSYNFVPPANAYWTLLCFQNNSDTPCQISNLCVHLRWTGYRDGDYEPYWSQVRSLPIAQHFPDGMQGNGTTWDSLYPNKSVKRWKKVVYNGTENWSWSYNSDMQVRQFFNTAPADAIRATGSRTAICSLYISVDASTGSYIKNGCFGLRGVSNTWYVFFGDNGYANTTEWKAHLAALYTAGTPLTVWYELAEPVTTPIDPPIPMSFRVSDYGLELSLPQNDRASLLTAPFRGLVAYSQDYTRTITNLPRNYTSQDTLDDLLAALGASMGKTITKTWNASLNKYEFSITE